MLALVVIGTLFFFQLLEAREQATKVALKEFRAEQLADSVTTAAHVQQAFKEVYQGLKSIARLPTVRRLSREAATLSADAQVGVQEIYNNLASNISLSELYVVPAGFDPDKVDPATQEPEKPLMTFDDTIVGLNADRLHGGANHKHDDVEIEETEIFEYRVMKRQIADLQRAHSARSDSDKTVVPGIASEEVVTCDNRRYSPRNPDDRDRTGIVYSVPYYDPQGRFAGLISAVVLSSVIADLLPDARYAIKNASRGLVFSRAKAASAPAMLDHANKLSTPANYVYSEDQNLTLPDVGGAWSLWHGVGMQRFETFAAMREIRTQFAMQASALFLTLLALLGAMRWFFWRHQLVAQRNMQLENQVEERTVALVDATRSAMSANEAKSEFLARITHEIRTPLHVIMSATELIDSKSLQTATRNKISLVRSASQSLLELVNQVLDLSAIEQRKTELALRTFEPRELLRETFELLQSTAAAKGNGISSLVEDSVPRAFTSDPARIKQVLINLIGNAIKFTSGGLIKIRVTSVSEPGNPSVLRFIVSDTGGGIPKDDFERIFNAFDRGSASPNVDGAGLGLAISRQLVQLMGGEIQVQNVADIGATFTFTVVDHAPSLPRTAPEQDVSTSSSEAPKYAGTVLLVEDDQRMQGLTREILEDLGLTVIIAADGLEAIARYHNCGCDLVLMDYSMPKLDGVEAVRRMTALDRQRGSATVPIIGMSARGFASDRRKCLDAGMVDYLRKPFTRTQLAMILKAYLRPPL